MRCIRTRYLGPTDHNGSRIIADDGQGNRVVWHYDPALSSEANHESGAVKLCRKCNWRGKLLNGWHKDAYYHLLVED